MNWNFFLKKLYRADEESEVNIPLMFVPGEYFFAERIFVPEEVLEKDLDSFLEIRLEGISPFPLDQLYWGYIYNPPDKILFFYAMYIGRLTLEEKERILGDEVSYVFPSFIGGLGFQYTEPTINFICFEKSISAIYWDNNANLPIQIETIKFEEFADTGREELLKNLNIEGYSIEEGNWKLEKAEISGNKSVRFESNYYSEKEEQSKGRHLFILNEKNGQTWNADIRPKDLTRAKRKEQRINRIVGIATLSALLAFGVLALGEIIGLSGKFYLNAKKAKVARQAPKVKLIEGQEGLAQKIEQISQNVYTPFQMLEILNKSRPKNVYFTSVNLGNQNNVVIEGVAASVDDLNKYTEDLNASGLIETYEVGQIASRQGRVTFKLDVKFNMAKVQEGEPAQETQSIPEEAEQIVQTEEESKKEIESNREEDQPIIEENTS